MNPLYMFFLLALGGPVIAVALALYLNNVRHCQASTTGFWFMIVCGLSFFCIGLALGVSAWPSVDIEGAKGDFSRYLGIVSALCCSVGLLWAGLGAACGFLGVSLRAAKAN